MNNKLQRFITTEMKRSEINPAKYNPRVIDPEARKGLKRVIKRLGLIEPLVVNKRTGNLVSGHQRLSILDEENKKGEDYSLTIALIDVDEKTEKEANIALNNTSIQGDYDPEILKELLIEIKPEDVGFSLNDLNVFDIDLAAEVEQQEKNYSEEEQQAYADMKEARKAAKDTVKSDDNLEYSDGRLLIVIFDSVESKEKVLDGIGMDQLTKHISEKTFKKLTGI